MTQEDLAHRPIRSYVLRQGRLTKGQNKAFETLWPEFGIDFNHQEIDPSRCFGNEHPVLLEIGFGNGESLAAMASHKPDKNYLGIEVHKPGVGHLLMKIGELGLKNVRVMSDDAAQIVKCIKPGSIDGCYLFFPDPWHKKKHHKRRILQAGFLDQLARSIKPGGFFHAATDWQDYAEHMMKTLTAHPRFVNSQPKGEFTPRPSDRPLTKFENRGQKLGHGVWDLVFYRQDDASTQA